MNYVDQPLAELAIAIPMATELFRQYRLDFCCGGKQSLKDACTVRSIDLDLMVEKLKALNHASTKNDVHELPLPELTAYIIKRYHEDLRKRLPELLALADKVERVHADHPACPKGLSELLNTIHEEILMHMMKEENVLFPLIDTGRGKSALMPVKVMMSEHDAHGRQLDELNTITSDFTPPGDACPTWLVLYKGLEKLEEELMNHIHLENNVLFPRALA
jgi:regulator of cell morphogenesis and NO signaling